jgi:L-lactate dehydrogenase complex protein LldE
MVDTLYPAVGLAATSLLEQHGAQVVFPPEQTCCGQPAFNAGYRSDALKLARHFVAVFWPLLSRGDIQAIVAPSGSCVAMVRHYYDLLFEHTTAGERDRANEVSQATYELTEYLVDVLGVSEIDSRCSGRLAYHACCHLLRELEVDAQPRRLLAGLQDTEIVRLPGDEECCGFGGLFAIKNAEISTAMGRRKVQSILASGADVVAVNDVSCMTHLNGILKREGCACKAVHIADVLEGRCGAPAGRR